MPSPSIINNKVVTAQVHSAIKKLLATREDVVGFTRFLAGFGKVIVFGGFVRDAIHNFVHADSREYRDLDLVLVGDFQRQGNSNRNHFGGYRRFFSDGLKIDYWTLNSTYAFSRGLIKPSLKNLTLTTVFTINACAFDLDAVILYENDAIQSIAHRRISFNCTGYLNTFPEYQAFRAIDFSQRLCYELDEGVREFVVSTLSRSPLSTFVRAVRAHRPDLSESELTELYERNRVVRTG